MPDDDALAAAIQSIFGLSVFIWILPKSLGSS